MSVPNPATTDWVPIYAGSPAFTYLGDYVPATNYKDGDIVMYNGVPWLAVKDTSTPPDPFPIDAPGSVPAGGTAGQFLTKDTTTDFDTSWQTVPAPVKGTANGFAGLDASAKHTQTEYQDRLREYCASITDANTARANGWYMGANMVNAHTTNWIVMRVTAHNDIWVTQEAWEFTTGTNSPRWQRRYLNGAWSSWEPEWIQMTQAQYNAATKYPNTLYIIVG